MCTHVLIAADIMPLLVSLCVCVCLHPCADSGRYHGVIGESLSVCVHPCVNSGRHGVIGESVCIILCIRVWMCVCRGVSMWS